jgi:fucose permease
MQYVPVGIGVVNLAMTSYWFRDETAVYQRLKHGRAEQPPDLRRSTAARVELVATVKQKSIWLLSIFYFVYLGAAITAGGWVVEFLHVVRGGPLSRVGYISSAFYGGSALGRFLLAEPTFRFGEKRMILLYALTSLALQIVFWRVSNIVVDAVMIALMGFFLGPCFATGVSVGSKLIPQELQSSGLGT